MPERAELVGRAKAVLDVGWCPTIPDEHPDYDDCACSGLEQHIPLTQAVSAKRAAREFAALVVELADA